MKIPLYVKIAGWFLLNIAFLVLGFWMFVRAIFPGALETFLMGPASSRLDSVAQLVFADLNNPNTEDLSQSLQQLGAAYEVEIFLVSGNRWFPVPVAKIPPAVQTAVRQRVPPPGPPEKRSRPLSRPDNKGERPPRRSFPKTLVRAGETYWVLIDLPPPPEGLPRGQRQWPEKLIIQSTTLFSGGLFLDLSPWLAIGAAALGVSLLFWLPLVGGITRSISRLTHATGQIAEGRFDMRVPTGRRDELGDLAESINHMTARLDGLVSGQKRFLGDVAHELCSPLARMEVALGILEQRVAQADLSALADVQEEVRTMSGLAGELLSFSKASLESKNHQLEPIELLPLVNTTVQREKIPPPIIRIPENCRILGRPVLLERALANLMRNAVRYAGETDPMIIETHREKTAIVLTVSDSGPGIPEGALAQVFDPFYRPEDARTRESGGTGLGLAIVKTCIESCGGTVACQNRPSGGLAVIIRLQAAR